MKKTQAIPEMFPQELKDALKSPIIIEFRNLNHFKFDVSKVTQDSDDMCGVTYKEALLDLMANRSNTTKEQQESIRNLVRSNLRKRGLITDLVYEDFRYAEDGVNLGVDIAKLSTGEPDCVMTPSKQYVNFFYELYISVSYAYSVPNETVAENVIKLLATIEELERQHIFIKITLVLPIRSVTRDGEDMLAYIPLFSHQEDKAIDKTAAVINERLLRKFFFAVMEKRFGQNIDPCYGSAVDVPGVMNIGNTFNEVTFFTEIQEAVR